MEARSYVVVRPGYGSKLCRLLMQVTVQTKSFFVRIQVGGVVDIGEIDARVSF